MVLPNLAFDALFWGLLLLAAGLDSAIPASHGAVSLLLVVGATYWAAQELAESLTRRVGWSQEALATSVSTCTAIFLYFWLRNSSDLSLLVLSIALMMGSLMVAISLLAAFGLLLREGRTVGVVGWLATTICSLFLGIGAGLAALLLGLSAPDVLIYKLGVIGGALVLWKLRERLAPPAPNAHAAQIVAHDTAVHPARPALFPQRGTLLDRLVPVAILGVALLAIAHGAVSLSLQSFNPPAVAAPNAVSSK